MNRSISIILHRTMNVIDVTMMQLFLPSKLRTKIVHISFDDVHDSFKSAIDNDCQSIFEIPFFNSLRKLNSKYGAKFSLYVFDDPSVVYPENVLAELRGCSSWLSVGYHSGIDGFANVKSVERFLNIFENTGCISGRTRLHGFSADKTVIQRLKSAGIREFFCSDDTRDSYGISDSDFSSGGGITREGMLFTKTDLRLEHCCFLRLSDIAKKDRIILFAHEKPYVLFEESKKLEAILKKLPSDVQYEN